MKEVLLGFTLLAIPLDPAKWSENFNLKECKMVDKMVKAMDGITTAASKK